MFAASTRLRRRRNFGVTSTSSSSLMNSMACSRLRRRGGMRRMPSSALRGAHVGLFLLARDVHVHVAVARVLADDHAFVDLGRGIHEHLAAFLKARDGVGRDHARAIGDERARRTGRNRPVPGLPAGKMWCIRPVPRVSVRNCVRKPMRPRAGIRNSSRMRPLPWLIMRGHHALAHADLGDDHALVFLGDVDDELFDGFHAGAVDLLGHDLRAARPAARSPRAASSR